MLDPNDLRAEADRICHATGSAALREAAGEIERLRAAHDRTRAELNALRIEYARVLGAVTTYARAVADCNGIAAAERALFAAVGEANE